MISAPMHHSFTSKPVSESDQLDMISFVILERILSSIILVGYLFINHFLITL